MVWAAWPTAAAPPLVGSADRYDELVGELIAAGMIDDASTVYWDLRPSSRFPTLEFRVADTCTLLDDTVLHAALVRSLVRVLAARVERGEPAPDVSDQALAAARWRAARYGLRGDLLDPVGGALVPAPLVLRRLLSELEPDLREHGEYRTVADLLHGLFVRGTSADRQRATYAQTGDLCDVVRSAVDETLRGVPVRTRSKAPARASNRSSAPAGPTKVTPTGRPSTTPAGSVTIG
jgi:carboxylate-amine ligase